MAKAKLLIVLAEQELKARSQEVFSSLSQRGGSFLLREKGCATL
jgi:hypothetical protein